MSFTFGTKMDATSFSFLIFEAILNGLVLNFNGEKVVIVVQQSSKFWINNK